MKKDNNQINGKIYTIINLIENKPCYVGQTIHSLKARFNEHCLAYDTNISRLINSLGKENFKIELITDNIHSMQECTPYCVQV